MNLLFLGQLKEAKEATNKSKKEIGKLQREYNLLAKYAKQWGKIIKEQGKFNSYQQKFYSKLCNCVDKDLDDVDQDVINPNETDEQSKLLEQLLGEADANDSIMAPPDILSSDTEVSKDNLSSLSKGRRQSAEKTLPGKQVKQTRTRAERRDSQDNTALSELPDKTPTCSPMTRKRTRKASENSVTLSSDADATPESEKEKNKSRTRSRAVKRTAIPELKGPDPISTSHATNVIAEQALPELITENPCQPRKEMTNILELETTTAGHMVMDRKERNGSLSSSKSKLEISPTKSSKDIVIPVSSTSSISEVISFKNIFDLDEFDDPPKQKNREVECSKNDRDIVQSQIKTPLHSNSLLGFGCESSSDSDIEMIPVPNCKLQASSSKQDQPASTVDKSLKTTFSGIFDKTPSFSGAKLHDSASGMDHSFSNINRTSCSIFALEADLDLSSSESDSSADKPNQKSTPYFSNTFVPAQTPLSLDEDHIPAVPESEIISDISSVVNVEAIQQTGSAVPVVVANPGLSSSEANADKPNQKSTPYFSNTFLPIQASLFDEDHIPAVPESETISDISSVVNVEAIQQTGSAVPVVVANPGLSSSEANADKPNQKSTPYFSNTFLPIQASLFDEDHIPAVPESETISDVGSVLNVEAIQQTSCEVSVMEANPKSHPLLADEKTVEESSLNDTRGKLEEKSRVVNQLADTTPLINTMSKSLEESSENIIENEKEVQGVDIVNVSEIMQKEKHINPFDMTTINTSAVLSETPTRLPESLDLRTSVVEEQIEENSEEPTCDIPQGQVDLPKSVNSSIDVASFLQTTEPTELEENDRPLLIVVEDKSENKSENEAIVVFPEQDNLPTEPVEKSTNVTLLVDSSPTEPEISKQLEENHDAQPIVIENNCEKVLQNEAVVTVSGKQGEELLKEPIDTSSIDIEMSKSLSNQEIEKVIHFENEKEIHNVSVVFSENLPMELESEFVDKVSVNALLVESESQKQLEEIQDLHSSVAIVEDNAKECQNEAVAIVTEKLQEHLEIEALDDLQVETRVVGQLQVETRVVGQLKETPEAELMIVDNFSEALPVPLDSPLEKNVESIDASSDKESPFEAEMSEPSEGNEEFKSPENHPEESQLEQSNTSFSIESGNENKILKDKNEAEQMTIGEKKTEQDFLPEEAKASSPKPDEESKSNAVYELSGPKSPFEIQVTKSTKESQSVSLVEIIEKSLPYDKFVAASPGKLGQIPPEYVDTFSSNPCPVEVVGTKSTGNEDQHLETAVVDEKTEKELRDENDVVVPFCNPQKDQATNVAEVSNTNLQVEIEVPEPMENSQESLGMLSEVPDVLLNKPQKDQRTICDTGVEFSTKNLLVETDLVKFKKHNQELGEAIVSDKSDSEVDDEGMLQEESTPNVAESLLQVEIEVQNPVENNQECQATVNSQAEKQLLHEVKDSLDKPQWNQQSMTNNIFMVNIIESQKENQNFGVTAADGEKELSNSGVVDPADTLQEESLSNAVEPLGKNLLEIETGGPKFTKDIQKSEAAVNDQPQKELLHEVEDSLDKPQQDQISKAGGNVESPNKFLMVDTVESQKENQNFGVTAVDGERELSNSGVVDPADMLQEESITIATEPLDKNSSEIETEMPKSMEENQQSQATVNDQTEKVLVHEVEDSLDKPQQDQQSIADGNIESPNKVVMVDTIASESEKENQDFGGIIVDDNGEIELPNSKVVDSVDTLQEESQRNLAKSSDKNSPESETEVSKSTEDLEFEVLESQKNKPPIEDEIAGKTETECMFVNRITKSNQEMSTPLGNQGVQSIPAEHASSEKSNTEIDVEPRTIPSDVEAVQESHTIPPMEETVAHTSPEQQAISDRILESCQPISSEEKRQVGNSLQIGATKLITEPTFPITNNAQVTRDSHLSLFNPPAIPEPIFSQRNSSITMDSSKLPRVSQTSEAQSAFKVPRVPNTPPRIPDVNLYSNVSRSKGVSHGVKRTAVDDEVAVILKQIRTNIIELPTTVSPLPKSPEPQSITPVKIEEPKSRFPVLPRCAFNWTGKKLPISDQLTERFGGYLHPGVQVRVRFRRVSRRLRDIRSPDVLSHCFQGVSNFAEAERRPKPLLSSVPFIEDIADVEPDRISGASARKPPELLETRPAPLNTIFSNQAVMDIDVPENPRPSTTTKAKVNTPARRPKDLFGSDSSCSESESDSEGDSDTVSDAVPDAVPPPNKERPLRTSTCTVPIQERLVKPSTLKNLKEKQPEPGTSNGSKQSPHIFNSSRAQILSQLVEPIIPLGRGNRSDNFLPAKQNEVRRDLESPTTDQTRHRLGFGRGVRTSQQPTISPCSESLLCMVNKTKTTVSRVAAPLKRPLKHPEAPTTPVATTPHVLDSLLPLIETPFKKRVSHNLKRGLESDPAVPIVSPASKRRRTVPETTPPALSASPKSPSSPVPDKVDSQEFPISARTRQRSKTSCVVTPQQLVKLDVPSRNKKSTQKISEKSPNAIKKIKRLVENSSSDCETDEMEINTEDTSKSSSSEREERIFKTNEIDSSDSSNEKGRSPLQLPNNPQSPEVEKSSELPEIDESPESPGVEESPKSPDDKSLDDHESLNSKIVEIPIQSELQPSVFELVLKELQEASPAQPRHKQLKGTAKLKKEINSVVFKFFKDPEVIIELLDSLVERVMRSDSLNHLYIFIRILVNMIIRGWNDAIDSSHTPPAPPMAVVHQRCVIVLLKLDESNSKIQIEPNVIQNLFSDLFLSESSAIMFQKDSSLTLEEMCSISRAYTAVCRSRGSLAKARAFLFDCVYFMPPRSYALAFAIMSIWADVLRQVSFPLGPSCVDQTIAYVLLHNCKVKAVQGFSGKVVQTRSFLQNTYEYKKTTRTVDDLVEYLMSRFYETNSPDEASSLSWSLALLARWEGVDFSIQIIEKKLWPFLQRWSSGEGTNNSAAAVIIAIGKFCLPRMLGKTVPASKRAGVKSVLDAMKALLQSEGVVPPIQEAAIEAVIHLGEIDDPKSIIEIVKGWKMESAYFSQHMRLVLKAFLKRHSNLCVV
uniref:Uncharacterized protein n=1 Tax=Daphnia galeata TaxID=27404 RepID=A0A8J2RCN6_9CRUS|nr:unnamed protein product [Daphnia galeata]